MYVSLLAACGDPDPTGPTGTTAPGPTPPACEFAGLPEWSEQAALPTARESLGLVAWEGWLYASGGWTGAEATDDVVAAELGDDGTIADWSRAGPLPGPLEHHAAVVVDGELWVIGGDDGVVPTAATWHAPLADGDVGAFVAGPDLPIALVEPAAVVDPRGRIVVLGGSDALGLDTDLVLRLEDDAWVLLDPLPVPLSFAAATVRDGEIVLAGGSSQFVAIDTVWTSPDAVAWTEAGALPAPLLAAGLDTVPGRLVLTGGLEAWNEPAARTYSSPDAVDWTVEDRLVDPRFGHGSVAVDGWVVIAGGWTDLGFGLQDSVAVASACP